MTLDVNHQLNLVLSQPNSQESSYLFLLSSQSIEEVHPSTQSLVVNASQAEVNHLPAYIPLELSEVESPLLTSSSAGAAISQSLIESKDNQPDPVSPQVLAETVIQLLEERLVVNRSKRKVAEVVVRKTVETQMIKVPIRREKLIVEQVAPEPQPSVETSPVASDRSNLPSTSASNLNEAQPDPVSPEVAAETVIRLLEERLVVNHSKRKVAEVVARKTIETQMIEVPIRREKLIVEQVAPETKQLLEIDLGQAESFEAKQTKVALPGISTTVSGEFPSPRAASLLLDAIALQNDHGCSKVRVEILLEDAKHQETYQAWFDSCTGR
ncbi:MAG TPA: DUF2382 domain-containing protein [Candidatus Caenarcaniphilales bacterium]